MSPGCRRLTHALLLSLLVHTLLLSLTFGGQGSWLPGFSFPWQDRRIEVPDLRILVVPARVEAAAPGVTPVAQPLQQAWVEQPVAGGPALTPSVSRAPTPRRAAAAIVPEADPRAVADPRTDAAPGAAPAQMPWTADRPVETVPPPIPAPAVIAVAPPDEATWLVPAPPTMPTPVIAEAPSTSSPETAMPSLRDVGDAKPARIDHEAPDRAVERAKLDPSRQEGQRHAGQTEAAQQLVERQEAARAEIARMEAERQEAARVEAARIEAEQVRAEQVRAEQVRAARIEAARIEAARIEAARIEAARIEAARIEAARIEAARIEAARIEAARIEVARIEAARIEVAQEAAARREAVLRAIGKQLDEEATQREAAAAAARLAPTSSSARRYWLFGRTDPNAELILYAEAWSRKIQLNMTTFDMVREAAKQPHTDPVVTVAIRSDGSVESVTFVLSSGVAAIDEAIRRIVDSQKPYLVFPPGLAREYDVILIRRSWHFDNAIRIH